MKHETDKWQKSKAIYCRFIINSFSTIQVQHKLSWLDVLSVPINVWKPNEVATGNSLRMPSNRWKLRLNGLLTTNPNEHRKIVHSDRSTSKLLRNENPTQTFYLFDRIAQFGHLNRKWTFSLIRSILTWGYWLSERPCSPKNCTHFRVGHRSSYSIVSMAYVGSSCSVKNYSLCYKSCQTQSETTKPRAERHFLPTKSAEPSFNGAKDEEVAWQTEHNKEAFIWSPNLLLLL